MPSTILASSAARLSRRFACGIALLCLTGSAAFAVPYGKNLISNADAEFGQSSSTGDPVPVPGWTQSSAFTVVNYDAPGGFPSSTDPGPTDRQLKFFAGGNAAVSTATQTIDVSANAAQILTNKVVLDLSGWFGGFGNSDDDASLSVGFMKGSSLLSTVRIGEVKAADRNNKTGLLLRRNTFDVPKDTDKLVVTLSMTRAEGNFNDGYADSLSLRLRAPVEVTTTADSGPGSLREAIPIASEISFDPKVFAPLTAPHEINLLTPLPDVETDTMFFGPGARVLTIQRDGSSKTPAFRLLHVKNPEINSSNAATLTLRSLTFSNGKAPVMEDGGAVSLEGVSLRAIGCSFIGNSTSGTSGSGGAVAVSDGEATFEDCTFASNVAGNGGAIANRATSSASTVGLVNCTFEGNQSGSVSGTCDGFALSGKVAINIDSCTFSHDAPCAVALSTANKQSSAHALVGSTIFNKPTSLSAFQSFQSGSGVTSGGYNLSTGTDSAALNAMSDQNSTDPKLAMLHDNGGLVPSCALLAGSPAIDHGNTFLNTDGRGFQRPVDDPSSGNGTGNKSDIGAYEVGGGASALLVNISTRLRVGTGNNVLIGGFIITGPAGAKKQVMIRGLGPSLSKQGVPDTLADPLLQLNGPNTQITNDNWKSAANSSQIPAAFKPTDPREAVILTTLAPGAYTVILRGSHGEVGNGLVEVYDLQANSPASLVNISTRGFVQSGDNVMIGGFIINGAGFGTVVVRALGPSLTASGVQNAMQDPTLELHDAYGNTLTNDNWQTGANSASIPAVIRPKDSREAAIYTTLSPGSYTVIVKGKNESGVALVEAYKLN